MDKNKMIIGVVVLVAVGVVIYMMQGGETNYGEATTAEACGELEGSHWEDTSSCADTDGVAVEAADQAACEGPDDAKTGNTWTVSGACWEATAWERSEALAGAADKTACEGLTPAGAWTDEVAASCVDADGNAVTAADATACGDNNTWTDATAASCGEPASDEVAND